MPYDYKDEVNEEKKEGTLADFSEDTPYLDKTQDTEANVENEKSDDYDSILNKDGKPKKKIMSVLSLVIGIASLVISFFTIWGVIPALISVSFALLSRRSLGYFDHISVVGIILGAFSAVFPVAIMILEPLIISIYS